MIIVKGEVRFVADEIERLRPVLEHTIAAARSEPGCARYSSAIDIFDPNLIHISGLWSDETALDRFMSSPAMRALEERLGKADVESIRIDAYDGHYVRTLLGEAAAAGD